MAGKKDLIVEDLEDIKEKLKDNQKFYSRIDDVINKFRKISAKSDQISSYSRRNMIFNTIIIILSVIYAIFGIFTGSFELLILPMVILSLLLFRIKKVMEQISIYFEEVLEYIRDAYDSLSEVTKTSDLTINQYDIYNEKLDEMNRRLQL